MKYIFLSTFVLLSGCSITAQNAVRPDIDLRSGDALQAVVVEPGTENVLKTSNELTLR